MAPSRVANARDLYGAALVPSRCQSWSLPKRPFCGCMGPDANTEPVGGDDSLYIWKCQATRRRGLPPNIELHLSRVFDGASAAV